VDLRAGDDSWREGFRSLSGPWTSGAGGVVILVATEDENRAARKKSRSAVGVPWPAGRVRLASSRLPWRLSCGCPVGDGVSCEVGRP
jgi:hypothetical protein